MQRPEPKYHDMFFCLQQRHNHAGGGVILELLEASVTTLERSAPGPCADPKLPPEENRADCGKRNNTNIASNENPSIASNRNPDEVRSLTWIFYKKSVEIKTVSFSETYSLFLA